MSIQSLFALPCRNSLLLLMGLAVCGLVQADSSTPITSVVLYPGGASIERTAQISAGMTEVEFVGLPANFDMQTIRVQADTGISVGQIVTQDLGQVQAVGAAEAEIWKKMQALKDRVALIDVETKSADLVKGYLERLSASGPAATDKQQPYVDARSMAAVLETIRRSGHDALERMQKAEIQKRGLLAQIALLEHEMEKVKTGTKATRKITVNLAARQSGSLRLSYQVNGAGWKPAYRALLDSSASKLELERLAVVSQKTGEDWSGVKLKLSTSQPRQFLQAPEPQPWLLSYYKPQPARSEDYSRLAPAPAPALARSRAIAPAEKGRLADDYIPPVLENHGQFSTEYTVPSRVNLPTDGREISVMLSKQVVPVKQRVRVSPRLDTTAVVIAEAVKPEGVWLSGNLQLFRDGSYVGATVWNTQASEKFVFSFGRDDLVRVTKERAKENTGSTGFVSQKGERKVGYVYTISSAHKTPIDLLVLEPSPVSTSDEIKVEAVFQPKPSIETWEGRNGVVGWEMTLAPNQKLKFSTDYTIVYPKEGVVSGLP